MTFISSLYTAFEEASLVHSNRFLKIYYAVFLLDGK